MAKNNKTHFSSVLYSDETWVFDQSECMQGPIYIIKHFIQPLVTLQEECFIYFKCCQQRTEYLLNYIKWLSQKLPLNKFFRQSIIS